VKHHNNGGITALRGFRKQFLHTLRRIIYSGNEVIYPETLEDFAVYNSSGDLIEIVQVKDHKAPLTFSELKTFFQRSAQVVKNYPNARIMLASYGELGHELKQYIGADESTLKKNKKFSTTDMLTVFQHLSYVQLNEKDELKSINNFLTEFPMTIGDPDKAFDLLMQDIYRGAEEQKAYTRQILKERLQSIGKYLVERESHHKEWGTSIIPLVVEQEIAQKERLKEAFYEGISVNWLHISAGLDINRYQHLKAIADGFKKTSIVIIHGASGQGKSALAYRYLHDYCPSASRYEIRDLSTSKRALEVASALAGYGVPLTFYVDAQNKDKGLPEFLQRISELQHVNCLVSIREEDWRLTGLTSADIQFTDLELNFNRAEAQEIYAAWERDKGCHFPDFDQAWVQFAEAGPLLEFVYLLTHSESLHHRLQKQYERIVDEIDCKQRVKDDLKLIKYAAIAGSCGARIDLSKLSGNTTLSRSISRLEKEYLLRISNDGRYLTGLHPIRSQILTAIITDPIIHPWTTLTIECLPLIEDADLEIFLLESFIYHPEAVEAILAYLNKAKYESWTAVSGVMRALQWLGISEYIQNNKDIIGQVYEKAGDGIYILLDFDFLGLLESGPNYSGILESLPEHGKEQVTQWRKAQTPKSEIFVKLDNWLQNLTFPILPLFEQERDWQEFGQAAFWIGFRKYEKRLYSYLDWNILSKTVECISMESLTRLIYGLWNSFSDDKSFTQWYKKIRPILMERYRIETTTPYIEEKDTVIRAHFIVPLDNDEHKQSETSNAADKNRLHSMAIRHVEFLAQLFPDYNGYGCQGYGHKIFDFINHDDTTKSQIAAWHLTPKWITQINKTARILVSYLFRPKTWQDYSTQILKIRLNTVLCLDELRKHLIRHFRSKKPVQQLSILPDTPKWQECLQQLKCLPKLPLEALDSWGYTEEPRDNSLNSEGVRPQQTNSITAYLHRYQSYLQPQRSFFNGINNFLNQSPSILISHSFLGKAKTSEEQAKVEQIIQSLNIKIDKPFLPFYNLAESLKALPDFQCLYHKHFGGFSDKKSLSQLEQKETQTLSSLWSLWFFFTTEPTRHWDFPAKSALAQLNGRIQAMRKNIRKALKNDSTEELRFCWLNDSIRFEDKPALWVAIDGNNPINVYSQLDFLFHLLKEALGQMKLHSLEYYAIEFNWQHIVIVPQVRGKLLEKHVWAIPSYQFTMKLNQNEGLSNINRIPHPVEQELLNCLELELWKPELLNDARLFLQSSIKLQLRVQHILQIVDISELDEIGNKIVQSHFEKLQDKLSSDILQIVDKVNILASLSEQLLTSSIGTPEKEYLQEAIDNLSEIMSKLLPEKFQNGQNIFTIESMREWQENLSSIQDKIFIIYLLWCGYITSVHSTGQRNMAVGCG
jgi:hypothetical protein